MSLPTLSETVGKLQTSLQTKAKAEPAFRFYALWDKVCRKDVLQEAYRRCRANAGAAGVDGETFGQIDFNGQERWLETLREELTLGRYVPKPLLRVWIPKSNGGQRPLGIPTIRDRVVQMAAVLIIGPIFETDLLPQQYGFRPGLDAKMALRRVYWHVAHTSIPHSPLLRSLSRRITLKLAGVYSSTSRSSWPTRLKMVLPQPGQVQAGSWVTVSRGRCSGSLAWRGRLRRRGAGSLASRHPDHPARRDR